MGDLEQKTKKKKTSVHIGHLGNVMYTPFEENGTTKGRSIKRYVAFKEKRVAGSESDNGERTEGGQLILFCRELRKFDRTKEGEKGGRKAHTTD